MKLIYWKASTLILSWALLAVVLTLVNRNMTRIEPIDFGSVCIATAAYLLSTYNLLKPITKRMP